MTLSNGQADQQPSEPPAGGPLGPMKLPGGHAFDSPPPADAVWEHAPPHQRRSGVGLEREVFAQLGKGGDLANSDLEAICRLVSLLLRLDGDLRTVIDQLDGIGSSLSVPSKDGRIKSLGDGLAQALRKYLAAKEREGLEALLSGRVKSLRPPSGPPPGSAGSQQEALFKIKCPDCDSAGTLAFEEGCLKCHACGYSMC